MKKIAVLLYPAFSLQEITCLTSVLTVWFDEQRRKQRLQTMTV